METLFCYSHSDIMPLSKAGVPVTDLLVQRGYGIFDFLRIEENKPLFIEDHLDRFFHSAKTMRLPIKESRERIKQIIHQLIEKNNLPYSGLRLLIAGGESPDGYMIEAPHLLIIQQSLAPLPSHISEKGIRLASYPYQRQMAEVKTTDYLMAIWLQPWMKSEGADDILYISDDLITECPRSNIFMLTNDNVLVTPEKNMLKGVTRKNIIRIAIENNVLVEERSVHYQELMSAKEVFISSSTKRVLSVRQIDDHILPLRKPDSLTAFLYKKLIEKEKLESFYI